MLIVESTLHRYIFTVLLCRCVLAVATKIRHLTSNGKSEAEAWNASSVQLVKAAEVKHILDICEIERKRDRERDRERERERQRDRHTHTHTCTNIRRQRQRQRERERGGRDENESKAIFSVYRLIVRPLS